MRGFREVIGYADLIDLGYVGSRFTWSNIHTKIRLDRALATSTWSDIFPSSKVSILPPSISDHSPLLLQASVNPIACVQGYHRFRFESFWLQHSECESVVRAQWLPRGQGQPMFAITKKIEKTSKALDKWQRQTFRDRKEQIQEIRCRLVVLLDMPVSLVSNEEKQSLTIRLQQLLSQEESYWTQRAKVIWLKDGDSNTSYFHRKASNRRRKNRLLGLFDENGIRHEDDKGVENVVTSYFQKMFSASSIDVGALEATLGAIQPCVTASMNQALCASYTSEEFCVALFQMYPTKSPGPDGMPPLFYQHYWEIIGEELTEAVQNFLHSGQLLKQINFTHICLIPKVGNPQNMADVRPIALCNVL